MPTFSHSKLATYEDCPRKYKFKYVEKVKLPRRPEGVEAFVGKRVHEALEWLYKQVRMTRVPSRLELLEFYRTEWRKNWSDAVSIVKKEFGEGDYKNLGEKCLVDYYNHYAPFNNDKTIALEKLVSVKLGEYNIRGYIDRLSARDWLLEIHDYKTGGSLPTQEKLDADRQLALYTIGMMKEWPSASGVELVWHYMQFDVEMRSKRTPEQLEELKREVTGLMKEIERRERRDDLPARVTEKCGWCEYKHLCPAWKQVEKASRMSESELACDEGAVLADKFLELKGKEKEFKKNYGDELDKVEEKLKEFVLREKVALVKGTAGTVKATVTEGIAFPTKTSDPEKLLELEAVVKGAGLWEEASSLDGKKLEKLVARNNVDAKTRGAILASAKKRDTVRLSAVKEA